MLMSWEAVGICFVSFKLNGIRFARISVQVASDFALLFVVVKFLMWINIPNIGSNE